VYRFEAYIASEWIVTTNNPFIKHLKNTRISLVCFEPETNRPGFDPDKGASPIQYHADFPAQKNINISSISVPEDLANSGI
jgi:hypothetical protein